MDSCMNRTRYRTKFNASETVPHDAHQSIQVHAEGILTDLKISVLE